MQKILKQRNLISNTKCHNLGSITLATALAFSTFFITQNVQAFSLQQALQTAFDNNKRTDANDKSKLYAEAQAKAADEQVKIPEITLSVSRTHTRYGSTSDGVTTNSRSLTNDLEAGLSANLFRGWADKNNALAAESRVKALDAQLNSTNAFIPNTKGSIANSVADSFFNILVQKETLDIYEKLKYEVIKLKSALTDSRQIEQLDRMLQSIAGKQDVAIHDLDAANRDFKYAVTIQAPDDLDSFESVIDSLVVPDKIEKAFNMALISSPELEASRYQLEEAQHKRDASQGSAYLPRVDGGFYYSRGSNYVAGATSKSSSLTAQSTLSWTFSKPARTRADAEDINVAKMQSSLDATLEELNYNLTGIYADMESHAALLRQFQKYLDDTETAVQQLMDDIDAKRPIKFIEATQLFQEQGEAFGQVLRMKMTVVREKFKTQKIIGTLFDATKTTQQMQLNQLNFKGQQ